MCEGVILGFVICDPRTFWDFFFWPSPFFRLLSNAFSDFGSVGRKRKKKETKKKNWKRSLELGGPVSQRNIRGAWKQQDVVIKST